MLVCMSGFFHSNPEDLVSYIVIVDFIIQLPHMLFIYLFFNLFLYFQK